MIRLKRTDSRIYRGIMNYLVSYDHSSGSSNRYTVFVLNVDDPVTIGRELDLATVRDLIQNYENEAKSMPTFWGSRLQVLRCMKRVENRRLKK